MEVEKRRAWGDVADDETDCKCRVSHAGRTCEQWNTFLGREKSFTSIRLLKKAELANRGTTLLQRKVLYSSRFYYARQCCAAAARVQLPSAADTFLYIMKEKLRVLSQNHTRSFAGGEKHAQK
jgi:hypothetical protein